MFLVTMVCVLHNNELRGKGVLIGAVHPARRTCWKNH